MANIQFGMIDTSTATDIVPEFGWITHFPFWAFYKGLYDDNNCSWRFLWVTEKMLVTLITVTIIKSLKSLWPSYSM